MLCCKTSLFKENPLWLLFGQLLGNFGLLIFQHLVALALANFLPFKEKLKGWTQMWSAIYWDKFSNHVPYIHLCMYVPYHLLRQAFLPFTIPYINLCMYVPCTIHTYMDVHTFKNIQTISPSRNSPWAVLAENTILMGSLTMKLTSRLFCLDPAALLKSN